MSERPGNGILKLSDGGRTNVDLPLIGGTIGPQVIDVRKLYGETGYFTYDPGFKRGGVVVPATCRSQS